MNYDLESDIFSFEISSKIKIVKAMRFGGFIIHLSPSNTPILIEVLNAGGFLKQFINLKNKKFFVREKFTTSPAMASDISDN